MNRTQIDTMTPPVEPSSTEGRADVSRRPPSLRGSRSVLAACVAAAAALLVAGCEKGADEPTVGQRIDAGVAQVGQKTEEAAEAARRSAEAARTSAGAAVQSAGDAVKDAAITANVNAALARDEALSALKIDVDTSNGTVLLRGEAPSAEARARAAQLAQGVDGVAAVDNQLMVRN